MTREEAAEVTRDVFDRLKELVGETVTFEPMASAPEDPGIVAYALEWPRNGPRPNVAEVVAENLALQLLAGETRPVVVYGGLRSKEWTQPRRCHFHARVLVDAATSG